MVGHDNAISVTVKALNRSIQRLKVKYTLKEFHIAHCLLAGVNTLTCLPPPTPT